jgi:hypothetical protein
MSFLLDSAVPAAAKVGHVAKFAIKNPNPTQSAKGLIAG